MRYWEMQRRDASTTPMGLKASGGDSARRTYSRASISRTYSRTSREACTPILAGGSEVSAGNRKE